MSFNLIFKIWVGKNSYFWGKKVNIFINSSILIESETSEHPFIPQISKKSYGNRTKWNITSDISKPGKTWEEILPKLLLNKPQPLLALFLHHKEASWPITFLENYLEVSKEQSKLVAAAITALQIDSVHTTF